MANPYELPAYHKRAFNHNYFAPFIYHIIFKKAEAAPLFGVLKGDARIAPGEPGCAEIAESDLGQLIAKAIVRLQYRFPILQIYQYMVMPDHVHILLRVKDWSPLHLDDYMNSFLEAIQKRAASLPTPVIEDIFQPGYCDKPLLLNRNLDSLFRYIEQNPHRLAMRRQFPQFFRMVREMKIGETECRAYGNLFLLRNPDKVAVKISSHLTLEEVKTLKNRLLHQAAEGTILVSPFISKAEKEIREEAEALGASIILFTHEEFPEKYKPCAHEFDLCTQGRLLIISLGMPAKSTLSRQMCLQMNELAQCLTES